MAPGSSLFGNCMDGRYVLAIVFEASCDCRVVVAEIGVDGRLYDEGVFSLLDSSRLLIAIYFMVDSLMLRVGFYFELCIR